MPVRRLIHQFLFIILAVFGSEVFCAAQEQSQVASGSPLQLFEQQLIDVISRCEKSTVAIARVLPEDIDQEDRRRDPFGFRSPPQPGDPSFIPQEFASGVLIGHTPDDGVRYVLTTRHVVTGSRRRGPHRPLAAQYFVKLSSRHVLKAELFNQDERSDLAVLKLNLEDAGLVKDEVPVFEFGEAEKLRKGSLVIGLGNPYAIARDGSASASLGLISNISRRPSEGEVRPNSGEEAGTIFEYGALLHVDLRLQLGTSGGAIVDPTGKLVGLSTSLAALRGYESSVGFAVPFDAEVRRIVSALLQGNEVEYGFLGVMPDDGTLGSRSDESGNPLPVAAARLLNIGPDSPADQAELKRGDFVLSINGRPIHSSADLMLKVGLLGPGQEAVLEIWRPAQRVRTERTVRLGKWPVYDDSSIMASNPLHPAWRGLHVDYPTARRRYMSSSPLGRYHRAVVVTSVEPGSAADSAGIKEGDFITLVNGIAVQTPPEFQQAVEGRDRVVTLSLIDGRVVTVAP